jgi:hypothetical protein
MNKIWGFIYIMSFGTPIQRGRTTQVDKLNARQNKIIHTDLMNEATQPPSEKSISNTSMS